MGTSTTDDVFLASDWFTELRIPAIIFMFDLI